MKIPPVGESAAFSRLNPIHFLQSSRQIVGCTPLATTSSCVYRWFNGTTGACTTTTYSYEGNRLSNLARASLNHVSSGAGQDQPK